MKNQGNLSIILSIVFLWGLLILIGSVHALKKEDFSELARFKRGAAYAGGYGHFVKLSPSVALGTFGGHLRGQQRHVQRKQTVQEALGSYGSFLQGGHESPLVIGSGGDIFNKH